MANHLHPSLPVALDLSRQEVREWAARTIAETAHARARAQDLFAQPRDALEQADLSLSGGSRIDPHRQATLLAGPSH